MPKNIFGNPFNYVICWFTAMGCYLAINNTKFVAGKDTFFRFGKAKKKTASKNYCKALRKLVSVVVRGNIVKQYCRMDHFHAHGTRKGSSVLATSGTTCPPPLPSVFHRGEYLHTTHINLQRASQVNEEATASHATSYTPHLTDLSRSLRLVAAARCMRRQRGQQQQQQQYHCCNRWVQETY